MTDVVILQGLPGSGKTSYAEELLSELGKDGVIVSADDYFMKDGVYDFRYNLLSEAHAATMNTFITALQTVKGTVIVDNTATTAWEVSPYVLVASSFRRSYELLWIDVSVSEALDRQKHHVPSNAVYRMQDNLRDGFFPKHFNRRRIENHSRS